MARTAVLPIRLTPEERTQLYEQARGVHLSLSEFVRRVALKRRMPAKGVGEVNRETYQQLCRLGNNLNQLTRAVNEGKLSGVDLSFLQEVRSQVKEVGMQVLGASDDRQAE